VEQLRQEKQEIDQQLRAIQGSNMSMQSFSTTRRSDRAYSTDYDSSRSNRGSMRGARGSNRGSRNSMSSGNPRYSNNRRNDRVGEEPEEEYHRGGSYSNSGKYRGGGSARGGSGNFSHNKPIGKNDYRRGGVGIKDDQQQLRDGSSVDRGD
jgi:fragile X mental retardation protein